MEKKLDVFIVDTSRSWYAKLRPVSISKVHLEDSFWAPRLKMLGEVTLPTQYQIFEETGYLFNFRRAAGKKTGDFQGRFFNDSDVYKWIEAVAFYLAYSYDEKLRSLVAHVIDDVVSAQDEDGYLNSYFTLERKKDRWTNLKDMHELYCAGHLMQAGIALYRATGERQLLDAACKFADHISSIFGVGKRPGTSGHPEIEMALVELYRTTEKRDYLDLAQFFLDQRGKGLVGGDLYHIDHKPFRKLTEIVGHAVRSLYLNCGATDIYLETGEKQLLNTLLRLWCSMTERKMYVTGGVGARYTGEAFGDDYELPNYRAYAETCAAIANVMWNWRMLLATGDAKFADVMELALYNGVLSGISLDGKNYFYVNPLADRGKHRRQRWFRCACCPPNIARTLAYLPGYLYSISDEGIWIHLYVQSRAFVNVEGKTVTIKQRTRYPWSGEVEISLQPESEVSFSLYLRIPGWCRKAKIYVNNQKLETGIRPGGYIEIHRVWKPSDYVKLFLSMPIERLISHPNVLENTDKVALKRGPIVYCIEQIDNPDFDVWNIVLPLDSPLKAEWAPKLLNGVTVIQGEAFAIETESFKNRLYQAAADVSFKTRKIQFKAIPYYAWANRKPGSMIVWMRSTSEISIKNFTRRV
ncbi:glycoside hydrolase family 127 protein [Candidatus Bathyarchaeota archaeon]|nr:glycoside hydrolase family 127 protein [Candidatus Bathyarchaeota archaeon]